MRLYSAIRKLTSRRTSFYFFATLLLLSTQTSHY